MKIFSGKHRGRKIHSISSKILRPTKGKMREALFSILSSGKFLEDDISVLEGARVADLFCGTGALGLESLSRGASYVTFVDFDADHLRMVRANLEEIGESDNAQVVRADSCNLPRAHKSYDIIFLDPPYRKNFVIPALKSLLQQGWIVSSTIIIIEIPTKEQMTVPEDFEELDSRKYGNSKFLLLRKL